MRVDPETRVAFITTRAGEMHLYDLSTNPPTAKQVVKIGKKNTIRGLDVDFENGKCFLADYDDGTIFYYNFMTPTSATTPLEMINSWKGPPKPRVLKYWPERNELYVGCADGRMSIFQMETVNQGPICKNNANPLRFNKTTCWRCYSNDFDRKGWHHRLCC